MGTAYHFWWKLLESWRGHDAAVLPQTNIHLSPRSIWCMIYIRGYWLQDGGGGGWWIELRTYISTSLSTVRLLVGIHVISISVIVYLTISQIDGEITIEYLGFRDVSSELGEIAVKRFQDAERKDLITRVQRFETNYSWELVRYFYHPDSSTQDQTPLMWTFYQPAAALLIRLYLWKIHRDLCFLKKKKTICLSDAL